MANKPRIPLPNNKDAKGVLDLAAAIVKKHQADGAASVIRGELKNDVDAAAAKVAQGLDLHAQALAMKKTLEDLYEKRDLIVEEWVPLNQRVNKSLQGEYAKNLRRMGDHGFTVDDTPRPPKGGSKGGSKGGV